MRLGGRGYDCVAGLIDEVMVFNKALTSDDVAQMYGVKAVSGDVNRDDAVNILDLIFIRNHLGEDPLSSDSAGRADANGDGAVNITDLIYVRNRLGNSLPEASE
jgi:hypothetical protein